MAWVAFVLVVVGAVVTHLPLILEGLPVGWAAPVIIVGGTISITAFLLVAVDYFRGARVVDDVTETGEGSSNNV